MLAVKQGDDFILELECFDYETNTLFDFTTGTWRAKTTIRDLPHLGGSLILEIETQTTLPSGREPYITIDKTKSIITIFIPGEITRGWEIGKVFYMDVVLYEVDESISPPILLWQAQIYFTDLIVDKRVSNVPSS